MQDLDVLVDDRKVDALKKTFREYLQVEYSHLKDKSVILSDAFYLYRYDIGMTLWSALESKQKRIYR